MTITLPIHPRTGLTALGLRRDGRPIWPVLGGSEPPAEPGLDDNPPADPPKPDDQLGDPGKKALAAERDRAKKAEKEAAELRAKVKEFEDRDKSESEKAAERLAKAETAAAEASAKLLRLEVASEKGLTPAQAKRLQGATREELEADADELLASFPAATGQPKAPVPDPSQGSKGDPKPPRPTSLNAAVSAALNKRA